MKIPYGHDTIGKYKGKIILTFVFLRLTLWDYFNRITSLLSGTCNTRYQARRPRPKITDPLASKDHFLRKKSGKVRPKKFVFISGEPYFEIYFTVLLKVKLTNH